jgi:hypothetical protein
LSYVFFKKENLRGKTWWLSAFYSLVIQSVVRRLLLKFVETFPPAPPSIKQYLHLAVRFFIASSGKFDPLACDLHPAEDEDREHYEAARLAVRQKEWKSLGIENSGDYLRKLFEDDGLPIERKQGDVFDFTITSQSKVSKPANPRGLQATTKSMQKKQRREAEKEKVSDAACDFSSPQHSWEITLILALR